MLRQEAQIEAIRAKGYERIRNLQRTQQAELARLQRDGDQEATRMHQYYRDQAHATASRGNEELSHMERANARLLETERQRGIAENSELVADRDSKLQTLRENSETRINSLNENQRKRYEEMRTQYEEESQRNNQSFQNKFQKTLATHTETIGHLNERAERQIEEMRQDAAKKLVAYENKQNDPFYRLTELDAKLSDQGDHYLLSILIPDYEKQHLSATVKGDQLIVTGYRSGREEMVRESGQRVSSSSHQSFSQSFPIEDPVDSKHLSREDRKDEVIFRLPKKTLKKVDSAQVRTPAKTIQSRPSFPGISENSQGYSRRDQGPAKGPMIPKPGSDTLS